MKVRDIAAALEEFAPLPLQENYDNAGLIVGAPDDEVSCALLCVDITEEVMLDADEILKALKDAINSANGVVPTETKKTTKKSTPEVITFSTILSSAS